MAAPPRSSPLARATAPGQPPSPPSQCLREASNLLATILRPPAIRHPCSSPSSVVNSAVGDFAALHAKPPHGPKGPWTCSRPPGQRRFGDPRTRPGCSRSLRERVKGEGLPACERAHELEVDAVPSHPFARSAMRVKHLPHTPSPRPSRRESEPTSPGKGLLSPTLSSKGGEGERRGARMKKALRRC